MKPPDRLRKTFEFPLNQAMKIFILGAESLGREAAEIARLTEPCDDVAYLDDNLKIQGKQVAGSPVHGGFGDVSQLAQPDARFFVAVGSPALRKQWINTIAEEGGILATLIHPGAYVSSSATVGQNCMVNFGCHVGPNARLGDGCVLWSNVTLSHDAECGEYCFIAPGVSIGGYARIGNRCMIGINSGIRSDASIGDDSVIAMGNAVTEDVPPHCFINERGVRSEISGRDPQSLFFQSHTAAAQAKHEALVAP